MKPLALIILTAIAVRAWWLFSTPYMPGINGAYYLVQARTLLERGALGFPDLPLAFHLHAGLAWLWMKLSGMAQADAILFVVKLCDAVLPPLAAWPVFLLVRRWLSPLGRRDAVPLAAAALSCLAMPLLAMVGDFQKNSLALLWLATLLFALHRWLDEPTRRHGLACLGAITLLGLTHVGVLGASVVLVGTVLLIFIAQRGLDHGRTLLPWLLVGAGLLVLAATLVLWKFDPARIHRLLGAFANPARFSADGLQMPMPPGVHGAWLRWVPLLLFAPAVLPALILVWRRRRELPVADSAVVAGCGLTALALVGPWFSMDKSIRFQLIALIPAVLAGAFAVGHIATPWRRSLALAVPLLLLIGVGVPGWLRPRPSILSAEAMQELQGLAGNFPRPERALVSAQHGIEWWTAWFLRTRIAQGSALTAKDWQRYDAVYFLQIKSGLQMPMMGRPPGFPPVPRAGGGPRSMPPPPPGGRTNPMMAAPIPDGAEILHDGPCLKLARVAEPPANVKAKRE